MENNKEYIMYQGVEMLVNKRFEVRTVKKVELINPKNGVQFVVNAYELEREIDQTIKQ